MSVAAINKVGSGGISRWVDRRFKYLLIWPAILILLLVGVFPFINILVVSFQDISLMYEDRSFQGLLNYNRLFTEVRLWQAILHTVLFTIVALPIELVLGLLMALLFIKPLKAENSTQNHSFATTSVYHLIVRRLWLLDWPSARFGTE